jgi:hypothetical protein
MIARGFDKYLGGWFCPRFFPLPTWRLTMKTLLIALSMAAFLSGCVHHRNDGWRDDGRSARGDGRGSDRGSDRRHDDDRGRSRDDRGRPDQRDDRYGR